MRQTISIPEEMGGPGVGTNPDELLIGAAATCYLITLDAMIERKNLPVEELSLAEKNCMISNALRGNVRLEVEAQFVTK